MSNFNLQTSHPLIQSEQTFVLDRKVISVHSIDRDYKKWPNSNNFGIDLGEAFHNVQSLRLIDYSIPLNNYTFSTSYQNTKMSFNYTTKLKFSFAADNDTPVFNDKNGSTFSNNKTLGFVFNSSISDHFSEIRGKEAGGEAYLVKFEASSFYDEVARIVRAHMK